MANKRIPCGGFYFKDEQIRIEKTPDGQPLINIIGDGAGVTDYTGLTGKPQIGGKELKSGDNTLESLGIQAKGEYLQQGTKIPATDVTEDTTHKFVTDEEKSTWNEKANNTVASDSANGLMSSADFTKLKGVEVNANNYVLPLAGTSIGGVKKATAVDVVASPNATVISGTSDDAGINKIVTLANENKKQINALIQALKTAGIMG